MGVVSGMVSRQVLPACENLCLLCPGLRTRSRQPVKRYKKLISDIFPKSQEEEPNERKIDKLCEYAAKNPLRIPKMAASLEQRCYKELRNERFGSVKVVMCIYRKLLSSCKDQMSLFASSVMTIIQTLLDQANQDEMVIIGCRSLFDFINNQNSAIYMLNLERFVPKLCQLAQEVGDDKRVQHIRAAGLLALSAMVWFMGENSHISVQFDNIVYVVLENYGGSKESDGNPSQPDITTNVHSWEMIVNERGQLKVAGEDLQNPCFWSRVCLHNMSKLGKEATTMRRVLESLFRYFDNGNLWPIEGGIAFPVLSDMQVLMDDSGQNTHFLLSTLVKHLDHKDVIKQPDMLFDIVQVVTALARLTKIQSSIAMVSAVTDIIRHMRKSFQFSFDGGHAKEEPVKSNRKFHDAVDECLTELSSKIGDAGLILDIMATMLENITSITAVARPTMSAVYRTAQIIASVPNLSYQNKSFPETLFHQLLPAMLHPDHETRVGAHKIFSVVLVPSSVSPHADSTASDMKNGKRIPRTLSRTVSVFSSSAALFEKLKNQRNNSNENHYQFNEVNNDSGVLTRIKSSYSRGYSFRGTSAGETDSLNKSEEVEAVAPLRLSSHQISLLLSCIWEQSLSQTNRPENFEAIAHTFCLVLLFSRAKNSYIEVLIRSFQLAFSLRSISLSTRGALPPSRRRSLFVMSTSMIIFSAKAYDIDAVSPHVKPTLSENVIDSFLCLVEDSKLQVSEQVSRQGQTTYGSKEDDDIALRCLSEIKIYRTQSTNFLVSVIIDNINELPKSEVSSMREQLLSRFLPDESCSLRGPYGLGENADPYDDRSRDMGSSSFYGQGENGDSYDDRSLDMESSSAMDDEDLVERSVHSELTTIEHRRLLSVDQLLQSVLENVHHVSNPSTSSGLNGSYQETADYCEAILVGKNQRMSSWMDNHSMLNNLLTLPPKHLGEHDDNAQPGSPLLDLDTTEELFMIPSPSCAAEIQQLPSSFRLPASSPYDHFLKAAGC